MSVVGQNIQRCRLLDFFFCVLNELTMLWQNALEKSRLVTRGSVDDDDVTIRVRHVL